jgi:ABC-type bacteriocin/lantibiotic exporter with double-glycine peptidase domain
LDKKLHLGIKSQPDDTTCGPTCLHAVYTYFGDKISLDKVIGQVKQLKGGGTLAVLLGCHALRRGYRAKLYTFNLQVFDPTWFASGAPAIEGK